MVSGRVGVCDLYIYYIQNFICFTIFHNFEIPLNKSSIYIFTIGTNNYFKIICVASLRNSPLVGRILD